MSYILKKPYLFFLLFSSVFTIIGLVDESILALFLIITTLLVVQEDGISLFGRKSIKLLFIYYFIVIVYSFLGIGTLNAVSFKGRLFVFINVLFVYCVSYHLRKIDINQIKTIFWAFIILISISVVATTYVGMIDPMALRHYGFGAATNEEVLYVNQYRLMGMMSYPVAHAMSIVAVGLSVILCYDKNKTIRIVSFILLLLILRLLFVMTITTALLLAVFSSVIVISYYLTKGKLFRTVILSFSLFIVFFFSSISVSLLDFSENRNADIFYKLNDFFSYAQTGVSSGQIEGREDLYNASLNTFLSNPLFGGGKDNGSRTVIGGHSFFLDYLAYYGALALLYFVAWWKEYKYIYKRIAPLLRINYIVAFLPALLLFILKAESVCTALPFFTLIFLQAVFIYEDYNQKYVTIKK